jgi:hypothetical protein
VLAEDILDKNAYQFLHICVLGSGDEERHLYHPIHYYQDGVSSLRLRQTLYEVHGDGTLWLFTYGQEAEQAIRFMPFGLRAHARLATPDERFNEGGHPWPPILLADLLQCPLDAWMTRQVMVMVNLCD